MRRDENQKTGWRSADTADKLPFGPTLSFNEPIGSGPQTHGSYELLRHPELEHRTQLFIADISFELFYFNLCNYLVSYLSLQLAQKKAQLYKNTRSPKKAPDCLFVYLG